MDGSSGTHCRHIDQNSRQTNPNPHKEPPMSCNRFLPSRALARSPKPARPRGGLHRRFANVSRADGISFRREGERWLFPSTSRGDGIIPIGSARSAQRGFTLIEIILVLVLIGGIVAFAATRILGGGDRAKVNLARAQVQTLSEKVQQFEMDTGTLPNSLGELVSSSASGWLGPYAKEAELKDPWGTTFEYRMPGEGRPYDIVSLGSDRAAGGESTAADIRLE
jgi:general secretion pathway protein G